MDAPPTHRAVTDPRQILDLFLPDRPVHPYGIADVQQLWEVSRWWRHGEAAVGLMDLPGPPVPVVYAVSARDPIGTLALLQALDDALPAHYVVTGPSGLTDQLSRSRSARWSRSYVKFALRSGASLPPPGDRGVRVLERADLPRLERLFAADPAAGDFFHVGLLDTGYYLGVDDGDQLAAVAGVHVVDPINEVAAIGNVATAPGSRRRGLARRVVGALCHRLLTDIEVIGLNVALDNHAATMLYRDLGFGPAIAYEEAELVRRA